ncbi:DMT family transporter [Pseudophaeobacter profundi]|uniref:DMT family transporter n=1 Tax=Pseudophaeobacter profundi TaxID=3034152 RepID=UPI00242C8331|nr:DMT family transporter [Pseudophaeobacter profundi]
MQLIILVLLVLIAFAANSVLGRMAISWGYMDALGFGLLRLAAGAVMLSSLCLLRGGHGLRQPLWASIRGGAALTLYMIGFCLAYQGLDAGLGALVLFGVVQIAMFGWGALRGNRVGAGQLAGAGLAFVALAYVVWPDQQLQVPLWEAGLMALSGLGWAAYSLLGRGVRDPIAASAVNFLWATGLMLPFVWLFQVEAVISAPGVALAVLSGAVTSGLGYALWYRVLPQLQPAVAATIQLSVPVIAILGGVIWLSEPLGLRLVLGTLGVLAGIALVIWAPRLANFKRA